MNQYRSSNPFFLKFGGMITSSTNKASKKFHRDMVGSMNWSDHKNDIKICILPEKYTIVKIIDSGPQLSGLLDYYVVHSLYNKGFIYLNISISDDNFILLKVL